MTAINTLTPKTKKIKQKKHGIHLRKLCSLRTIQLSKFSQKTLKLSRKIWNDTIYFHLKRCSLLRLVALMLKFLLLEKKFKLLITRGYLFIQSIFNAANSVGSLLNQTKTLKLYNCSVTVRTLKSKHCKFVFNEKD